MRNISSMDKCEYDDDTDSNKPTKGMGKGKMKAMSKKSNKAPSKKSMPKSMKPKKRK